MAINKVIYAGNTLIDLTGDTISASDLAYGITAHDKSGSVITGQSTKDSDTSEDTAAVGEILYGQTAHARGALLTGSMANNGSVTGTISTKAQQYSIPIGYHDGGGKVSISSTEQEKIVAGNIKNGVTILGVEGTYSGQAVSVQSNKNATPSSSQQVITPDSPTYDYLAQVTVAAIPYEETPNAYGTTVTIG